MMKTAESEIDMRVYLPGIVFFRAACACGAVLASGTVLAQPVVYVNAAAVGANTGESWVNAFTNLQTALTTATPGSEIWVAAGAYRPAPAGGSRDASFSMRSGVAVYGGFAGVETMRDQRDPDMHVTILSGDLNGDDSPGFANIGENSLHVTVAINVGASGVLDGFTITGGNADGTSTNSVGGGMRVFGAAPVIHGCRFTLNSAFGGGGALDVTTGPVTVQNCHFTNNRATGVSQEGGGGAVRNYHSALLLQSCTISDNASANHGGGLAIYATGATTITDCRFTGNTSDANGGGLYGVGFSVANPLHVRGCDFEDNAAENGGGAYTSGAVLSNCRMVANRAFVSGGGAWCNGALDIVNCSFLGNVLDRGLLGSGFAGGGGLTTSNSVGANRVVNCLFSGNRAIGASIRGGGAVVRFRTSLHNCTFVGNSATGSNSFGGGVATAGGGDVPMTNCILRGNIAPIDPQLSGTLTVTNSNVQGGQTGTGNIDLPAAFVDADGADDQFGTLDDNARLLAASPCIDAGDNAAIPIDAADLDADGNTTEATPRDLDRGLRAFDLPETPDSGAGIAPIVDMGCYEYSDCNSNGTDDGEDIRGGGSADADHDGLPDECSVWVGGAGAWSNPANWEPPITPLNDPMSGRVFMPLIQGPASIATLDIDTVIDTLYVNARGTLLVADGNLTIASPHTIVNNGNVAVDDGHAIIARVTFDLLGTSPVTLAGQTAMLRSEDGVAAIVSHVPVEGQGIVQTPFVNNNMIEANVAGAMLQVTGTSALVNNAVLSATRGAILWIQTNVQPSIPLACQMLARGGFIIIGRQTQRVSVSSCGPIDIEPGSPASITVDNAALVDAESWTIGDAQMGPDMMTLMSLENDSLGMVNGPVRIRPNGTLNVNQSTLLAESLIVEPGGTLIVASQIQISRAFEWHGTDESRWSWHGDSALSLAGGRQSCTIQSWSRFEAASLDVGGSPSQGGNFELPTLVLAAGAAVLLLDEIDNGNRNGSAGPREAVYASALTMTDGAILNMNGLHLYVAGTELSAGPYGGGEIIDIPLPIFVMAGDMNRDGRVDGDDITAFVETRLAVQPPLVDMCRADVDGDGELNANDVQAFVQLLLDQ